MVSPGTMSCSRREADLPPISSMEKWRTTFHNTLGFNFIGVNKNMNIHIPIKFSIDNSYLGISAYHYFSS
ncbi:hypothetical protein CR159_15340 [Pollutimonas subterranea]|uniref:Uncharacterized protein n=1 Tax=Pollutimonas subterranea TaxID=2045210 RepID=A0A2N4U1P6_9BURK|nr:hypothetical protein CR159_15340 [Pollutimonas subterranea]